MMIAKSTAPDRVVIAGALGFIAILWLAVFFEHDLFGLHALQSLMYVAVIALVLQHSRWGYFLGFSIATFWNYTNFFVTNFLKGGLEQLAILVHTGSLPRPDLFIAVPAVLFHFMMIFSCAVAYVRTRTRRPVDGLHLAITAIASTAYFAGVMAITLPRYLALFPRLLHPELHI